MRFVGRFESYRPVNSPPASPTLPPPTPPPPTTPRLPPRRCSANGLASTENRILGLPACVGPLGPAALYVMIGGVLLGLAGSLSQTESVPLFPTIGAVSSVTRSCGNQSIRNGVPNRRRRVVAL